MRTFKDMTGREWCLDLTVDAIRRIKAAGLGVDLLNIEAGDPPHVTRLKMDLLLLCDVVWAVVAPQAAARTLAEPGAPAVDSRAFGEALGGDAINQMEAAFWGALSDFFQSRGRTDLLKVIEAQARLVLAAVSAAGSAIDRIDVQGIVDQQAPPPAPESGSASTSTAGNSSGSSPVSLVVTPALAPSAN